MKNSKSTKRALLTSALALLMCVTMLIGATFAWFTDTASTGVNKIQAGNLKMEVTYKNTADDNFEKVNKETPVFNNNALWEPGHVEYVVLKVSNTGSLALKYKLGINIANEVGSTNVYNNAFNLSDYIRFAVLDGDRTGNSVDRDALVAAATDSKLIKEGYSKEDHLLAGENNSEKVVTLVVWMPTTVGNEANHKKDATAPSIDLGISVVATQYTYEKDSIDDQYDKDADYAIQVNKDNIQDYLDGKYGSIDGMTLVLAEGDYGTLELGRATKYPGGNTQYRIGSFNAEPMTFDDFYATKNNGTWSNTPYYIRSMNNVTFKAAGDGVKVAGVYAFSGHRHQAGYDYVLDREVIDGSNTYFVANRLTNITFDGITFTAKSDINTSIEQAIINGFTFKNCTFNIGSTEDNSDYFALRYYNENNNDNVRNLVVDNCKFNNCRQGVYTSHVYGVSVTNSTFNTIGYHAIAVQDGAACDHGKVVITKNIFTSIGANAIRFDKPGAGTQITIKENRATGIASKRYAIQATELVDGITYDISNNTWNGAAVSHDQFKDKNINP